MKNRVFMLGLTASLLLVPALTWAHHSNAVLDKDVVIQQVARVTRLAFAQPHVAIYFTVKDDQSNEVDWFAGGGNPVSLAREGGWDRNTLRPGDLIVIQGNPHRNGRPIMSFRGMYHCSGDKIPLSANLDEPGEYITRVAMPELDPPTVRDMCANSGWED